MSAISDAVELWWDEIQSELSPENPVHIHLDKLVKGHEPATSTSNGVEAYGALLGRMGHFLEAFKPMLAFPLADSVELDLHPPDIESLTLRDEDTPPSLILVARTAFGRTAMLMEEYEVPLRVREAAPVGYLVWIYRVWRDSIGSGEFSRAVYVEHYFSLPNAHNAEILQSR